MIPYRLAHSHNGAATQTLRMALTGTATDFTDSPAAVQRPHVVADTCGWNSVTVVAVSAAVRAVRRATTMEEFGVVLSQFRTEAGLSLKVLAARFAAARLPGLSRATLSRSCNGFTLFQTEDQVVAFVTECGETDATVWVAAWERARADRRAREHQPASTEHTSAPSLASSGLELDSPDDEVAR